MHKHFIGLTLYARLLHNSNKINKIDCILVNKASQMLVYFFVGGPFLNQKPDYFR